MVRFNTARSDPQLRGCGDEVKDEVAFAVRELSAWTITGQKQEEDDLFLCPHITHIID